MVVKRVQLWLTTGQMVLRATDEEVEHLNSTMRDRTVTLHDTGYIAKWNSELVTINTDHIVAYKVIGDSTLE